MATHVHLLKKLCFGVFSYYVSDDDFDVLGLFELDFSVICDENMCVILGFFSQPMQCYLKKEV